MKGKIQEGRGREKEWVSGRNMMGRDSKYKLSEERKEKDAEGRREGR